MIAYNKKALDDRFVRKQAGEAYHRKWIAEAVWLRIAEEYKDIFYTPNFFIRLGLFLATLFTWSCSMGFFGLMQLASSSDKAMGSLYLVFGLGAYVLLEVLINNRRLFRAGIDDALLYMGGCLVFFGFNEIFRPLSSIGECVLALVLALASALRYADRLMVITASGALICLVFTIAQATGAGATALLPFVFLFIWILIHFIASRLSQSESCRHYHESLVTLRIVALLCIYLAGNYYVVREGNTWISDHPGPVALSFIWWTLTFGVPLFYIFRGLQKKDTVYLWTGLLLVAAAVFTFRYYFHVIPAEVAMVIGGVILTGGSLLIIRYLKTPRNRFTADAPEYPHLLEHLPVEAFIQAETFRSVGRMPDDKGFQFGGGDTGGGGAGGTF